MNYSTIELYLFCYYKEEEAGKEAAVQTVSERNKKCGWGQKGKRIESSRDVRQGESAVGRGVGQK